jgi:nucleoside-diphosphate-sugar epimerase
MTLVAFFLPRFSRAFLPQGRTKSLPYSVLRASASSTSAADSQRDKGKLLVLGGTGFLGQKICKRAVQEGYSVVSLSRRGLPPSGDSSDIIDYRQGDARTKETIADVLKEGDDFVGVVHCIGLLFDDASGFGSFNKFVSGSGSLPDSGSSYETITRLTAFNAIEATMEYAKRAGVEPFPFLFTSAAEAGWPEVAGGKFIESLAPDFIKRYLAAKRAVESKLLSCEPHLRPIIVRPSLIYSMDRLASFLPVGAFFVGNKVGLPFVDQPVTVETLATAIVKSLEQENVRGILRYHKINELGVMK